MADHRIERARERYNLELDYSHIRDMEDQIRTGKSFLVRKEASGDVHIVMHGKQPLIAVYAMRNDGRGMGIATFLPANALNSGAGLARFFETHHTKAKRYRRRKMG